ncbi:hypothetical protein ACL6C3_29765 [Capilliphycus salinus ALCB114379]|uniref:hypothetical protein n=1 Tax=Capilliphycus salinus TaxID=2768948 RepID=UPI0039A56356
MKLVENHVNEEKNSLILDGLLWVLYLFPILATFWLIKRFGVNVPVWADQWALIDLFEAFGTFDFFSIFKELWELNNNHRMIFPKLIFAATAFFSNWNIFYELYWSFGLALISFFLVYKLAEITRTTPSIFLFHTTNIITCILMFSWVQYRNWLWGFQVALYLINFCVILTVFIFNLPSNWSEKRKLILAALLCIIASFSSAQGLMSWLAVIPSVLNLEGTYREKIKRLILWLTSFLACGLIYSIGYKSVPISEDYDLLSYGSIGEQLRVYIQFFLNVLAAPLTGFSAVALIFGLILIGSFIFLFFHFWVERPEIRHPFKSSFIPESCPWISIGLFSILSAILMTIGRANYGAEYGLTTSRYTTHSLLLTFAVIHLFNLYFFRNNERLKLLNFSEKKLVYSFCLGLITSLIWVRSAQSLNVAKTLIYEPNQISQNCLYLINYLDVENSKFFQNSPQQCLTHMVPTTVGLSKQVERLQKINLRNFAEDISFVEQPNQIYGFISSPWTSENSFSVPTGGIVKIDGWAALPNQPKQPQLVFLSLNGRQSFFANAYVNLPSPDVVEFLNSKRYKNSRWEVTFDADNLNAGNNLIKAWVYNPKNREFVKLSGEIQVTVEEN